MSIDTQETIQQTWHLELTEDELIALAKVCSDWQESKLASGHMTIEELLSLHHIDQISQKFPDEDWFSEEVKP